MNSNHDHGTIALMVSLPPEKQSEYERSERILERKGTNGYYSTWLDIQSTEIPLDNYEPKIVTFSSVIS